MLGLREKDQSWYSQAFEKPGQAQAKRPANLSFMSHNPVIQYLPIIYVFIQNKTPKMGKQYIQYTNMTRRTCEVPMVLPEPYFSLSDSRDTSCAIRFFSEPVPQLRDS